MNMPLLCRSRNVGTLYRQGPLLVTTTGKFVKPQDKADFSCSTSLQSTLKNPRLCHLRFLLFYYSWSLPPFSSVAFFIFTLEMRGVQKPPSATIEQPLVSALQYSALKFIFVVFPEVEELGDFLPFKSY